MSGLEPRWPWLYCHARCCQGCVLRRNAGLHLHARAARDLRLEARRFLSQALNGLREYSIARPGSLEAQPGSKRKQSARTKERDLRQGRTEEPESLEGHRLCFTFFIL